LKWHPIRSTLGLRQTPADVPMIAKWIPVLLSSIAAFLMSSVPVNALSRPCGWLTVAEASAATGAKATPGEDRKNITTGAFNGCIFHTGNISRFVLIEAYERANAADAQKFFDQVTRNAAHLPGSYGQTHSLPITVVQAIGDQAADVAAQLFVRKGPVIFAVSIATPLDEAQTPAYAQKRKTLAAAIVSRL
jgi:hypothetical protein